MGEVSPGGILRLAVTTVFSCSIPFYFHMTPTHGLPYAGQIQPPLETVTCPEEHGPAGRGVPVLQTHAGQRSPPDAPHGNAPRQKEINQPIQVRPLVNLLFIGHWKIPDSGRSGPVRSSSFQNMRVRLQH